MQKVRKVFNKDYVYLSEGGKLYVFRFVKIKGKKYVQAQRKDAFAYLDSHRLNAHKHPITGTFEWTYGLFGTVLDNNWICLGKL